MSTYSLHGAGHKILAHLEAGPATSADIRHAITASKSKGRRLWRTLAALKDDGLAYSDSAGFYHLTQAGMDGLTALRCGHPITIDGQRLPRYAPA